MPQTVQGVIARSKGAPVELVDVVVPDPGPGEAVVGSQACGVCHTDLHYREGGINDEFPFLLGHEAAGVVEAVGEGVTEVAPGDFVVLNWRAVCGAVPRLRQGQAVVLLRHPQRHAEDDPHRRHRADPGPRHRRLRREDPRRRRPVHQGRPRGRRRRRRAARLRGHGGLRRRRQHRQRRPRRHRRRHRLRRGRQRRRRRSAARRRDHRHRGRRRPPQARVAPSTSAPRTPSTPRTEDVVERDPRAHRRQRRRRRHRRRRAPRDLRAGLLRPRPRRHRRARRRADARPAGDAAADRPLRPRRRPEVELVRRLPARRATSRCSSTSTARAASTSTPSSPSRSASATSRPRSSKMHARRRCCARWWCCERRGRHGSADVPVSPGGVRVERTVPRAPSSLDGGSWDVENNVWLIGDDASASSSTRRTRPGRSSRLVGDRDGRAVLLHARPRRPRQRRRPTIAARDRARTATCTRTTGCCGSSPTPTSRCRRALADGDVVTVGDVEVHVLHTPGHSPGACCFHVPALGVVFTGDTLFARRPGRDGPVVQRLPDHHRLDPRPAAHPAAETRRAHRTRRHHASGTRRRTCRSGSTGVTDPAVSPRRRPAATGAGGRPGPRRSRALVRLEGVRRATTGDGHGDGRERRWPPRCRHHRQASAGRGAEKRGGGGGRGPPDSGGERPSRRGRQPPGRRPPARGCAGRPGGAGRRQRPARRRPPGRAPRGQDPGEAAERHGDQGEHVEREEQSGAPDRTRVTRDRGAGQWRRSGPRHTRDASGAVPPGRGRAPCGNRHRRAASGKHSGVTPLRSHTVAGRRPRAGRAGSLRRVSLRLYDTATRELRDFVPVVPARPGSTSAVSPPRRRRTSGTSASPSRSTCCAAGCERGHGYDVTLVRNVTDIDDKILAKSPRPASSGSPCPTATSGRPATPSTLLGVLPADLRAAGHRSRPRDGRADGDARREGPRVRRRRTAPATSTSTCGPGPTTAS